MGIFIGSIVTAREHVHASRRPLGPRVRSWTVSHRLFQSQKQPVFIARPVLVGIRMRVENTHPGRPRTIRTGEAPLIYTRACCLNKPAHTHTHSLSHTHKVTHSQSTHCACLARLLRQPCAQLVAPCCTLLHLVAAVTLATRAALHAPAPKLAATAMKYAPLTLASSYMLVAARCSCHTPHTLTASYMLRTVLQWLLLPHVPPSTRHASCRSSYPPYTFDTKRRVWKLLPSIHLLHGPCTALRPHALRLHALSFHAQRLHALHLHALCHALGEEGPRVRVLDDAQLRPLLARARVDERDEEDAEDPSRDANLRTRGTRTMESG